VERSASEWESARAMCRAYWLVVCPPIVGGIHRVLGGGWLDPDILGGGQGCYDDEERPNRERVGESQKHVRFTAPLLRLENLFLHFLF